MRRVGVVLVLVLLGATPAWGQSLFLENCTVGSDTNLTAHTPDVGTSWTLFEDTTAGASTLFCDNTSGPPTDDTVRGSSTAASARVALQANPADAPTSADYYIEVTHAGDSGSSDDFGYAFLRAVDNQNYYGLGWYRSSVVTDCFLFSVVAGVYAQLDSGNCDVALGDVWQFIAEGDSLRVTQDGVTVLEATDATFTEIGTVGIGLGNIRNATDDVDTSFRFDTFTLVDGVPEIPEPPTGPTTFNMGFLK